MGCEEFVKSRDNIGWNILHNVCCGKSNFDTLGFLMWKFKNDHEFMRSKDFYGNMPLDYLSEQKKNLFNL